MNRPARPDGPVDLDGGIRLVDRTNNGEETLFHHLKRGERRRSGRKIRSQGMEMSPTVLDDDLPPPFESQPLAPWPP